MTYTLPRPPASEAFQGKSYDPARDHARLTGQLGAVFDLMKDGQWRGLWQIMLACGGTEASISARLRDLRKLRYGAHTVERRHVAHGFFEYRVIVNRSKP